LRVGFVQPDEDQFLGGKNEKEEQIIQSGQKSSLFAYAKEGKIIQSG
jgi:hypothetical protein